MKQAIIKAILTGRQETFGPQGDERADRRHHGGPDRALLHYNHDHYAAWRAEGHSWRQRAQRLCDSLD